MIVAAGCDACDAGKDYLPGWGRRATPGLPDGSTSNGPHLGGGTQSPRLDPPGAGGPPASRPADRPPTNPQ